jgi:large subunit ribosomal protein L24
MLKGEQLVVEGINIVKKHTKPNPARGITGGIMEKEMPIHVSNVSLYNPTSKKGDRVGFRYLENGKKVRYFKSTNEVVEV